ncbi:MAG: hypothetical protein CR986_00985 [Ignavibacteriae bacterium]|nr:MAG: hypothetical protein CR986_00985 [Ignavibacteriota bacterium]
MNRKIVYLLILISFLPALLFAGNGRIKGKVTDLSTGEALIGANIIIIGSSFGAATDENGDFIIMNLDAGVYELKASYLGYQSITIKNVRVNTDLTTEIDFKLPAENISVETVTVIAQKPLIKKDATSSIRSVTGEDISNLPVRGVTNIVGLQAGVIENSGTIHIRGSRPDEVGYYLEGNSISNPEDGGRAVTISNDAVEELSVESGGFSAEFGGSNAGIIRSQLRSGTNDWHASIEYITDNVGFKSKDDFYKQEGTRLGAYWYGQNETSFSLSGPIWANKIKVFYNLNYDFDRSRTKKAYPGLDFGLIGDGLDKEAVQNDTINLVYPKGVWTKDKREAYTHSGTVTMDFNPILIRVAGTYTDGWNDNDGLRGANIFSLTNDRLSKTDFNNGSFSLKLKHVVASNLFYELSGGVTFNSFEVNDQYLGADFWAYGDSVANAKAGNQWIRTAKDRENLKKLSAATTRYVQPANYKIYGFKFEGAGRLAANHQKGETMGYNGRFDLTYLPTKHHNLKIGGEFKQHVIRAWSARGQSGFAFELENSLKDIANPTKAQIDKIKADILYKSGVNNYGYDIYGNKTDGGGKVNGVDGDFYAPHKPIEAGIYVQDRIEFDDIILNLGLRYDYFDIDNLVFKKPDLPDDAIGVNFAAGRLYKKGFKEVKPYSSVSPRLSVSFPVTDQTVFHAGYGKYVQQPSLNQAYDGYHSLAYTLGQGFFFSRPTGQDLRPIKKTHYEVGFRQQLTDFMSVDISGYYDDVKGQIYFIVQDVSKESDYSSYNSKANGDFQTTKGFEVQLTMRRYKRLSGSASLSFSDAAGTGSNPNSNAGIVGAPLDGVTVFRPQYVSPLNYDRPFKGNLFIDYRFGKDDGGPILEQLGISLLANFASGHPFTRGIGGDNMESDSRFRQPLEPLNSSLTPSIFNLDLKIDKSFNIFDDLYVNVYVRVLNLFNNKNIETVYKRTGAANDDGYIADPDLGGQLLNTYGEIYGELYNAMNIGYNDFYQDARQILVGIRLEY